MTRRTIGFNEADAFASDQHADRRAYPHRRAASMRPTLSRRINLIISAYAQGQCGGFNEADAFASDQPRHAAVRGRAKVELQ